MPTLLFLFAILTTPQDRIICDLWTRTLTQQDFAAACPALVLSGLRVDVYSLDMSLQCSKPAESLPRIQQDCALNAPLDQYILRIVHPAQSDLICMIESQSEETPTPEEIAAQCPNLPAEYIIQFAGTRSTAAPFTCPARSVPVGMGLYEQPATSADLATIDDLPLLTDRLIWFGFATPETARPMSLVWQNHFDTAIHTAAIAQNVPARLLKRMMMIESQFWMFYDKGEDGEVGILQITDNGLDTLLRWDPQLDPSYQGKSDDAQAWSRNTARQLFTCYTCSYMEAVQKIKDNMTIYARTLAAYHCRAVTLNPALTGADQWRQAVLDFNGSPEYLIKIER